MAGEPDAGLRSGAGPVRRVRGLTVALSPEARAIEAVLIVAVEPVPPGPAGRAAGAARRAGRAVLRRAGRVVPRRAAGASRWSGSPAAAASRPIPTWPPTSSGSPTSACPPACRPPPSRPWPSWPTSSRCRRAQIAALRGVNVDGVVRLLEHRGYIAAGRTGRRARAGRALRHHRRLPGAARARPARPAAPGRGPAARARGPGRARGADAPGRGWLSRPDDRPGGAPLPPASGCRRCWPGSASAPAGCARTSSSTGG